MSEQSEYNILCKNTIKYCIYKVKNKKYIISMQTDWNRLKKVIDWSRLSVNAFAKHIGLKRAENLYQIKNLPLFASAIR